MQGNSRKNIIKKITGFSFNLYFLFIFFLCTVIGYFLFDLFFSNFGIGVLNQIKIQNQIIITKNIKQNIDNQELLNEVDSLRVNNKVIINIARENLGLINNNEIFYQTITIPKPKEKPSDILSQYHDE